MFKIGDKVKIIKREGGPSDYPFGFVQDMALLSGKIATIVNITDVTDRDRICNCRFYNGDDHIYTLDIDNGVYDWHSSMFILEKEMEKTFIVNNSPGGLFNLGTPVLYRHGDGTTSTDEIESIDEDDNNMPYLLKSLNNWVYKEEVIPNFIELFKISDSVIFYSEIFDKMILSKQESEEYPILATLEDEDILELTRDFKYFKNSKSHII